MWLIAVKIMSGDLILFFFFFLVILSGPLLTGFTFVVVASRNFTVVLKVTCPLVN